MSAPYRTLPAAKLEETTPPITWIVEGLFLQGGAAILSAPPKHAKSYLALDIADFRFQRQHKGFSALLITGEDDFAIGDDGGSAAAIHHDRSGLHVS